VSILLATALLALSATPTVYAQKPLPIFDKLGGDFSLTNHQGKRASLSDYQGKIRLLNFGYTSCPDVCPMVLARLTQLERLMEQNKEDLQVVFVSFDPARDSVKQLNEYVGYFSKNFVGCTGKDAEIAAVAKQFGTVYVAQKTQSAAGLLFSHSDFIYLLDREGKVRGRYNNDVTIHEIKQDIDRLLESSSTHRVP